jgi:hypothetical protein
VPGHFGSIDAVETFRMEQGGSKHTDFQLVRLAGFKDAG